MDKKNKIAILRDEVGKNRTKISELNRDIEDKNAINKVIRKENEDLKVDKTNKTVILLRCLEAVRNTRDKMRTLKTEKEKMKRD